MSSVEPELIIVVASNIVLTTYPEISLCNGDGKGMPRACKDI